MQFCCQFFFFFFYFILSHSSCPLTDFVRHTLNGYIMSHEEVGQKNLMSGMSALISRNVWGEVATLSLTNQFLLPAGKQTHICLGQT